MKGRLEEPGEREEVGMLTKANELLSLNRLEGSQMLTMSTLLQVQGEWHLRQAGRCHGADPAQAMR